MSLPDDAEARLQMVRHQLEGRGIKDQCLLLAMRTVPRHLFVPDQLRPSAYDDCALPLGSGQTISQPYMVAIMSELLGLSGSEKVLEVGTGSGYQAAILSRLCNQVISIERLKELSDQAHKVIAGLDYKNIMFIVGDGTEGYPEEGPYDAILVTAACPNIPSPLIEQLAEGGRLVIPLGDRFSQILTLARKANGRIITESSIGCVFVPLIGKYGWEL